MQFTITENNHQVICFDYMRGHHIEACIYEKNEFLDYLVDKLDYDFYDRQYERCDECGDWEHMDDITWCDGQVYCSYHADQHLFYCNYCEDYHDSRNTNSYEVHEVRNGNTRPTNETVCTAALENGDYFYCDHCNEVFDYDHRSDDEDYTSCTACNDEREEEKSSSALNDYSYKPKPVFFGQGLHLGVELEVEFSQDNRDAASKIYNSFYDSKYYMKRDGSLDNGIEFVTHPLTIGEHKNFWPQLIKNIKAADSDSKSHDVSSCGLHIHVGRDKLSSGAIQRATMFFSVEADRLQKFARRFNNSYAKFFKAKKGDMPKIKKHYQDIGRYSAINLTVSKTIEFRFFKGTLKTNTLLATIEFTHLLVEFLNNAHSLNCTPDNYWQRFLKLTAAKRSDILNDYLEARQLA
jgi:hypothetical protein